MFHHLPRIGLRTVKTAIAVAVSLWLVGLRNSPAPIFAAIGAISAMSRTLGDAFKTCLTQFCGIVLGAIFGTVFVNIFVDFRYIAIILGMIALIPVCVYLKLQFAVSLACMVFTVICLSPPHEALVYSVNRFIDTSIGLFTALAVNVLIKPYNNRARIDALIRKFLLSVPGYVEELAVKGRYPDIEPLNRQLGHIDWEVGIFATQHLLRQPDHEEQTAFLQGCTQLAHSVFQELTILCTMDERGTLSEHNCAALGILGLKVPKEAAGQSKTQADAVSNYHLEKLIESYRFLNEFTETK